MKLRRNKLWFIGVIEMDRIIMIEVVDIVSGESLRFSYNADTKIVTVDENSAIQVKIVSDA
jgi:hypothetical protein